MKYSPNMDRPWLQQYIMIQDQVYAPFDRPETWISELGGHTYSEQFIGVCPWTHKVWIRAPILGREKMPFAVLPMVSPGQKPLWGQCPGSVIYKWPELDYNPWVQHLPKELLNREVLLLLKLKEMGV